MGHGKKSEKYSRSSFVVQGKERKEGGKERRREGKKKEESVLRAIGSQGMIWGRGLILIQSLGIT